MNLWYNHDGNWIEIEKCRGVAACFGIFWFSTKSEQISLKSAKSRRNLKKCKLLSISNVENANIFDEILLKYWVLSGAKACKSCRSRQELSNEYLVAKFGVDTAENEPLKVHLIIQPWDLIFAEPPRPLDTWHSFSSEPSLKRSQRSAAKICESSQDLAEIFQEDTTVRVFHWKLCRKYCAAR